MDFVCAAFNFFILIFPLLDNRNKSTPERLYSPGVDLFEASYFSEEKPFWPNKIDQLGES